MAVSLSLFVSRMTEMGARTAATLGALPHALAAAAKAVTRFATEVRPAAAATAAAAAAHRLAQDLNVRPDLHNLSRIQDVGSRALAIVLKCSPRLPSSIASRFSGKE